MSICILYYMLFESALSLPAIGMFVSPCGKVYVCKKILKKKMKTVWGMFVGKYMVSPIFIERIWDLGKVYGKSYFYREDLGPSQITGLPTTLVGVCHLYVLVKF